MSEMLSPAVYLRCSENSTEKPWNGLACSPAMNPSTMNLARRSSRATWRITSGFRYFSAVLDTSQPPVRRSTGLVTAPPAVRSGVRLRHLDRPGAALVLGHVGLLDLGEEPLDERLGR